MKVVWTRTAIGHLAAIHQGIAQDSPPYARRVIDRITAAAEQLGNLSKVGETAGSGTTPVIRFVFEGAYQVICRQGANEVCVLAVLPVMGDGPAFH